MKEIPKSLQKSNPQLKLNISFEEKSWIAHSLIRQGFEGFHYCESDMSIYQGKILEIKSLHNKHMYKDPKALSIFHFRSPFRFS